MHIGGLLSFAVGGTLLILLLIDISETVIANGNTFSWNSWLYLEAIILGFIAFLLIGYGLFANMKTETKPKT